MVLTKEGKFRSDIRKKFFYTEVGEAVAQAVQRNCECPIPGGVQGQAGALGSLSWWVATSP